ncbi:MAG: GGDEF domain-containing protein [Chloroflexota bacterium]|nr:GGDEF domain-containing protein [Chloroflexota bacterium]
MIQKQAVDDRMLQRILGRMGVDLGEAEADYRVFYLKDDITQSILYILITMSGVLSMVRMDFLIFQGQPGPLTWIVLGRVGFSLISFLVIIMLWRTGQPDRYDRIITAWLIFTVLFLLFSNFTRPPNLTTSIFDVIVTFAIYIFSPPKILYSILMALGFSAGTIYVDYVYKAGVDPLGLNAVLATQLIAHALGLVAGLKIQSYRRKSFRAYMKEKDARELAAYLANIDPLTKSLTRRHFFNIAEAEFLRYLRYRHRLSMLVLDADYFKNINDTYGHHAGDLVLRNLSLVVLEQKRAQDTFGRLGGEEFGLLLPETNREQAKIVAERIQRTWAQTPSTVEDKSIQSTVSIGVAEAGPQDQSFEDVLRRADRMMYRAKESGRNTVVAE